jgi:hypothetical protein
MILAMFMALVGTALMPLVFMAALVASSEAHPRSLAATLRELGRPLADGVAHQLARLR